LSDWKKTHKWWESVDSVTNQVISSIKLSITI
jgi:hypothetical protein